MMQALKLFLFSTGIYGSYLTYGYLQESIYKVDEHDGTRFTFTSSLLALQCFINMLMGILAYTIWSLAVNEEEEGEEKLQKRPNGKDEKLSSMFSWKAQFEFMGLALAYLAAMGFSNESIKFVSYPTQALAKSCKTIPVMLSRVFFLKESYPLSKYICVVTMVIGIAYFQLARIKSKEATPESESLVPDEYSALYRTIWGYALLVGSLSCDAYTGPKQEQLKRRFEFTPLQLMSLQNFWACLFALGSALFEGDLTEAVEYVSEHPNLIQGLLLFSLTSAFGQIFIFFTVLHFDSLVLTTITTTRKFLTILVSVFAHGHYLSFGQWLSVLGVFGAIMFDSFKDKCRRKKGRVKEKQQ